MRRRVRPMIRLACFAAAAGGMAGAWPTPGTPNAAYAQDATTTPPEQADTRREEESPQSRDRREEYRARRARREAERAPAAARQVTPPAPATADDDDDDEATTDEATTDTEQPNTAARPNAPAQPNAPERAAAATGRRDMVWDRARQRAEVSRRHAEVQRELMELLATHGARHPRVEQVTQRVDALARQLEELDEPATPERTAPAIVMERAAYLGVAASQATPVLQKHLKLPDGVGLVVDFIEPGSPAETAGLQVYDVLLRLDGQLLVNPQQLAVLVRTFDPGADVKIRLVREGEPTEVGLRLVEREVKPIADVEFWDPDAAVAPAADVRVVFPDNVVEEPPPPPPPPSPVGAERRVEPGSVINVVLHDLQGPEMQTMVAKRVGDDGTVRLPFLDEPFRAAGLTTVALPAAVTEAYRHQGNLAHVERYRMSVSVTLPDAAEPTPPAPVARPAERVPEPVPDGQGRR